MLVVSVVMTHQTTNVSGGLRYGRLPRGWDRRARSRASICGSQAVICGRQAVICGGQAGMSGGWDAARPARRYGSGMGEGCDRGHNGDFVNLCTKAYR